jgi:hypothetical protein
MYLFDVFVISPGRIGYVFLFPLPIFSPPSASLDFAHLSPRFVKGILTFSSSPDPTTFNYEYTISPQGRRSPHLKLIQIIFDV